MATDARGSGTRLSVRTLTVLVVLLLVTTLVAAVVGLVLVRQPALDPLPVPSVSQI